VTTSRSSSASSPDEALLAEQRAYYEARAPEYDDWFNRRGRYDRGEVWTAAWVAETEMVRDALGEIAWSGAEVLELAPGTGIWTEWLVDRGATVHGVDASTAMTQQLLGRLGERMSQVTLERADLFNWRPSRRYDAVFAGFFLSHVPVARLDTFFPLVSRALRPGGAIAFVDSRREPLSTAADHVLPTATEEVMTRRLDDGREFRIVKNFYSASTLEASAHRASLRLRVGETPTFFIYGVGAAPL
jgi:demethylmenaquinone methyltransferase/2-methoxy-6-polyprenyl-1,4-benzoquinol methylase